MTNAPDADSDDASEGELADEAEFGNIQAEENVVGAYRVSRDLPCRCPCRNRRGSCSGRRSKEEEADGGEAGDEGSDAGVADCCSVVSMHTRQGIGLETNGKIHTNDKQAGVDRMERSSSDPRELVPSLPNLALYESEEDPDNLEAEIRVLDSVLNIRIRWRAMITPTTSKYANCCFRVSERS